VRQFLTFIVASDLFTGDLASQSPQQDSKDFNSMSDQYKESYFHPVKLTGTYNCIPSIVSSVVGNVTTQ